MKPFSNVERTYDAATDVVLAEPGTSVPVFGPFGNTAFVGYDMTWMDWRTAAQSVQGLGLLVLDLRASLTPDFFSSTSLFRLAVTHLDPGWSYTIALSNLRDGDLYPYLRVTAFRDVGRQVNLAMFLTKRPPKA